MMTKCQKPLFFLAAVFLVMSLFACVSPSTKFAEAEAFNNTAKASNFVKTPREAAQKEKCQAPAPSGQTPTALKWELKFDKSAPLIRQEVTGSDPAFGPYRVICFSVNESGDKKIKFTSKHQGGGYSKAYYSLPVFSLLNGKFQPVKLTAPFKVRQEAWTGDYLVEGTLPLQKNENYVLVVESDNRHPTTPWSKYPNYGMGVAGDMFPIEVYTSVFGVVTAELTP